MNRNHSENVARQYLLSLSLLPTSRPSPSPPSYTTINYIPAPPPSYPTNNHIPRHPNATERVASMRRTLFNTTNPPTIELQDLTTTSTNTSRQTPLVIPPELPSRDLESDNRSPINRTTRPHLRPSVKSLAIYLFPIILFIILGFSAFLVSTSSSRAYANNRHRNKKHRVRLNKMEIWAKLLGAMAIDVLVLMGLVYWVVFAAERGKASKCWVVLPLVLVAVVAVQGALMWGWQNL